jgi:hypothetical protein
MPDKYFFMDVNLKTMKVLKIGTTARATLTGNTKDADVHRVFLTTGQFNKLKAKLDSKA